MKKINVYVPDGYEIDKEKSTFEEIFLRPITPTLPKKWEDLKKVTGWYADEVSQASRCGDMPAHSNNYNVFVTKAQADARQVLLIAEHDSTQADIAALNNFNPATDIGLANITKVNNLDVNGAGTALDPWGPV